MMGPRTGMDDRERMRMILRNVHERATRLHRASAAPDLLVRDLDYIAREVEEAREVFARLVDSNSTNPCHFCGVDMREASKQHDPGCPQVQA